MPVIMMYMIMPTFVMVVMMMPTMMFIFVLYTFSGDFLGYRLNIPRAGTMWGTLNAGYLSGRYSSLINPL